MVAQEKKKKSNRGRKGKSEKLPDPDILRDGAWSLQVAITAYEIHTRNKTPIPIKLISTLRQFQADLLIKGRPALHEKHTQLQVKLLAIAMMKDPLLEIYRKVITDKLNRAACRKLVEALVRQWSHGIRRASSTEEPLNDEQIIESLCVSGDSRTNDDSIYHLDLTRLPEISLKRLHKAFHLVESRSIESAFVMSGAMFEGAFDKVGLEILLKRSLQSSNTWVFSNEAIGKAVDILKEDAQPFWKRKL